MASVEYRLLSLSEPETSVHSSKGRLAVTQGNGSEN